MAKINRCLRLTFIIFNGIFACIGCVLLYGTVKATAYSAQISSMGGPTLAWAWAFSISFLGISCLGLYAGKTEKVLLLKIFAGFMGLGLIIMMILGIVMAVAKSKFTDAFNSASDETETIMADPSMREAIDELQLNGHCCGIWKVSDWSGEIPNSCDCNFRTEGLSQFGLGSSSCEAKPLGSSGPDKIYARPCADIIVVVVNVVFQVAMGICFGFAVLAFLGLLISYLMIHQAKRQDEFGRPGMAMKGF